MKQYVYDTNGTLLSSYDTRTGQAASDATSGTGNTGNTGNTTSSGGSAVSYTDVGILSLNQQCPQGNIYDFRVPGDSNNNTFRFRFPRAGKLLGVTLTGSVSQDGNVAVYVTRYNASSGNYDDVLTPSTTEQSITQAQMQSGGYGVTAAAPISYQAGDAAAMKFTSPDHDLTVDLAGFFQVQY